MLLSNISEVNEIDNQIGQIHGQLSELYLKRSTLMTDKPAKKTAAKSTPVQQGNEWAEAQYDSLVATWRQYGVALPSHRTMKTRLLKAYKILQEVSQARPEWHDTMTAVFVPKTADLPFPLNASFRKQQAFVNTPDYIESSLTAPKVDKQWRLLLVYKEPEGLYAGSLEMMLNKKERIIANYDVTALGVREYAAFSLQQSQPIDSQTWTILPKTRQSSGQITCVGCIDGQFRFVVDEINGVFGDNRFRPAIEVKA